MLLFMSARTDERCSGLGFRSPTSLRSDSKNLNSGMQVLRECLVLRVLGGSWVVKSGVISPLM